MTGYFDRIHEGLPLDDVEIIDMHAHMGPFYNMHTPACDPESMIRVMDRLGIDKVVLSPTPGITSDIALGNSMMLEAVADHRGRMYGACLVNGNYPELSLDELDRCFGQEPDVVMVKAHPLLAKCRMDDRRMKKIYEFTSDRRLFFLAHTWLDQDPYGNQDLFGSVVPDYPDIRWVMGHSGGTYGSCKGVELAERHPNIFLDLTMSMIPARQVEFFVENVGAERVLFGTDNPFIDPRPAIGRLFLADISDVDKEKIAGGNAREYIDFG